MSTPNRSPSPMLTRPNPNPNPNSRSHQERDGITPARKSFSGYPLGKPSIVSQPRSFLPNTPANSPAEYARNSFSRDYEQKENERDHHNLKPIVKPRSPSISKGSKNFMSPTISAASKINPSPRKKVLGERNEAIRTSASLSDGKFQFFSSSSLEFSDENDPKSNTENPTAENKLPEKIAAESILQERKIGSEPDLVVLSPEVPSNTPKFSDDQSLPLSETPKIEAESNLGSDVKNSSCSSPTVIAPLDADPSLPPYDPKTNFLSPRPQFLCYRPNPRIESYINNGLRLEDEFTSESCSETENCEEAESEDQEDSSSSSSSLETSLQEKPPCSESKPTETQEVQEALEAELEHRPHFFKKWKTLAFVVVFLFGLMSLSVTYNPSLMSATYREEIVLKAYNDPHVVLDLAKENFNALFQDVKLWSAYSVDHLYQMIHGIREVNTYGPLPYSNLTVWQEEADYVVGEFELGTLFERREDYVVEDFELSSIVDEEEGIEEEIEDTNAENFSELQSQIEELDSPVEETDLDEVEESSLLPPVVDAEDLKVERSEIVETEIQEAKSSQEETDITADLHDEYPANLDETEIQEKHIQDENHITADLQEEFNGKAQDSSSPLSPEVLTPSEPVGEDDQSSLNNVEIKEMRSEEVKIDSEKVVPEAKPRSIIQLPSSSSEGSLAPIITTVILAVPLMAIAGFMYIKPKKTTAPISAQSAMEKSVANEKEPSISQSIGQVEVDMMSEPCASEMSSFQKTTSYSKRSAGKGFDEAQSQSTERRPKRDSKRESLASSSSEYTMCSYGSFTTYSILPSKKGDEEMVTPVRRSSRIRNHQVTSP